MSKKKSNMKKIAAAVVSTTLLFSLVNSAFASTPGVRIAPQLQQQAESVTTVSNEDQEEEITVKSITATNGSITVKLSDAPEEMPELEDFIFTKQINGKDATALKATGITWNKDTKTAYFTFKALNATKDAQKVVVNVDYNGSKKSAKLFTIAAKGAEVDKVQIINNAANATLLVGSEDDATLMLTAVAKDKDGNIVTGKKVAWSSSNAKVASVDKNGKVKAIASGKAVISATIDGKEATLKVTVTEPKVEKVEIENTADDAELVVGSNDDGSLVLKAVALDKNGKELKEKKIEWTSLAPMVATVDDKGKVTAIAVGKAKIKATVDGKSADFEVTVKANPSISLETNLLSESSANDGSISGTQTVTLTNGKFASDISAADVTVNNLPAGLGVGVTRNSDTQITIFFTGQAFSHTAADSKSNLSVTINKAKVSDAKENLVSGTFSITFADPVIVVPPPVTAPTQVVTGLTFPVDIDKDAGQIQGNLSWTPPSRTSNITHYSVYFLNNSNAKVGTKIVDIPVGTNSYAVPANTPIPSGATKFGVFAKNGAGENATGATVEFTDVSLPTALASTVTFTDEDIDVDQISGNVTWTAATDESNITHYAVYFLNADNSRGTQIGADVAKAGPLQVNIGADTAIPSGTTKIAVFSKNGAGLSTAGKEIMINDLVGLTDAQAVAGAKADLDDADLLNGNSALNNVTGNLTLPTTGINGTAISWVADHAAVGADGSVIRPANGSGDATVTLTATISKNGTQDTKTFTVIVKEEAMTDAQAVAGAKADLDDADLLNGNSALNNVTGNVTLPTTGINGTTVGWGSDNAAVGTDGTVTRPANGSGDATVTLTATISKNGTQDTKTFTVTVKEQEMTDAQAVAGAKADLDDADLLNGNSALNNVTGNLTLPITGINGTTVGWGSDNAAVGTDGSVIRPANGSGDATVTLTATISKNGTQDTKTFTVTVKEQEMTDAQAVAGAKADLDDADLLNGNSALNNVTGNVTLPTTGINGTTVGWGSDNAAVGTDGTVTRPANGSGDATVTLTATISKNGTQDTKTFTVTVKEQEMTDAQAVAGAKADLDDADLLNGNSALNNVTGNVTLPTTGINGTTVGWGSDNAAVGTDGTVTRPANGSGDATVTLTATISKNGTQDTKTFTVTVKEQEMTDAQAVAGAKADLDDADLLNGNSALNNITGNLTLPTTGINGTTVGWGSDNAAVGTDGTVTRPANGSGDATVTLTATISKNGTQDTKTFTVTVKEQEMTDAQAVAGAKADLDDADLLNGNSALNNVTGNLTLPITGINGTTVGWGSDNAAVGTDGTVTRPANGSGDATVTLTATISKNGTQDTKTFTVTVKEQEMTDAQAVAGAKADLDDADLLNGNSALNNVTGNVTLPTTGINGTTVGWGSDNAAVGTDGTVTRPANGSGDATVTLTATISKNGTQDTKTFTVTVKEQEMTDAQAVAGAKADLDDADLLNGNSALNNVTGNVTLPTTGINGTTVGWGSDNAAVGTDGTVTRPANGSGDATVTLTATISKNGTQDTKTFTVTVKEQEMTDAQAVAGAKADLDDADLLNGNSALNNVTGNLTLPTTGINGTTVGWGSDNAAVGTDGTVTRPANGSGDATVTLTATISKNGTQETKTFTVTVKEQP